MIDAVRFIQLELFLVDGQQLYLNPDCLPDLNNMNPMVEQFGSTWIAVTCGDCSYLSGSTCQKSNQSHDSSWNACGLIKLKI
ncbi:hypothetical protein [Thermoactinomyces sp. DSM 45892]|uniref:hypothetical protein n=1 Tax=Thermoactinomyces sp. DSM 45892 TaxID=1882753 RepID=UPI00089C7CD9|nr:hypothetical protein [Thermoactinomyces sp. DSM 45892]SDY83316.1 hypothetical protein SAMN05444416_10923 [Thermoactinomyces sp. DSM 45892]